MAGEMLTWEQAVEHARNNPAMADLVLMCFYDDPIEKAAARFKASPEWPAITSLLKPWPSAKVLEIGAGRGVVSWAFATDGCEVTATEPNPSALVGAGAIRELCAATGTQIHVEELTGEILPFADASFDFVVCRGVLHHVQKLRLVCAEAHRVLKPGGKFLAIKEPAADSPEELTTFLANHPLQHLYGGEHAHPIKDYLSALRGAGFRKVQNFGQFDHIITSYPPVTTEILGEKLAGALALRIPSAIARRLARSNLLVKAYGLWLTFRQQTPGRLHSFLCQKAT